MKKQFPSTNNAASRSDRQLLYVSNPGKKKAGLKMLLKDNCGVSDEVKSHVLGLIGVDEVSDTNLVSESESARNTALVLEAGLCHALGGEKYLDFLGHISESICDFQDNL